MGKEKEKCKVKGKGKKSKEEKDPNRKWTLSIRTLALAQPNRFHISPKFDPNVVPPLTTVSRAALRAKATARVTCLAEPNRLKRCKKFDSTKVIQKRFVSRAALWAQCSSRNEHLARNVNWKLVDTLKTYQDRGDFLVGRIQKRMELSEGCMYREMYWPKPKPPPPLPPKMLSIMYKKGYKAPPPKPPQQIREEIEEWCIANSQAKPLPPPPKERKKKQKPLAQLQTRLKNLSIPRPPITEKLVNRPVVYRGVKKGAMKHVTTEREKKLSAPVARHNPELNPEGVQASALEYQISPRMKALCQARVRATGGDGDLKENPYGVVPMALKAWCSPRTKDLAKPTTRK